MSPNADLADVVSLMLEANVRSVPVIDDGILVGIIEPARRAPRCGHG
jgi:CBS domain-containing protein